MSAALRDPSHPRTLLRNGDRNHDLRFIAMRQEFVGRKPTRKPFGRMQDRLLVEAQLKRMREEDDEEDGVQDMRFTAIVPIVVFFVMSVVVGLRLLLQFHRTRQLPELCIGLGVVLIAGVGMPLSVLGRLPSTFGTTFGNFVFAVGLWLACAGIALLFAFNWRVFRADARWARNGMVAVSLAMAALALGLIRVASHGDTLAQVVPRTRPWAMGVVAMVVLAFAWGGFEALRYYLLLRRRRALGLADPVVTNRFLLWGVADWAAVALCASVIGLLLVGRAVLVDPLALCTMAVCGSVLSVTWYLTFFPPKAYLRFLTGASPDGAGTGGV